MIFGTHIARIMTGQPVSTGALQHGDVVTFKGQPHVFTVCPPVEGAIEKDGWVWTARSTEHGSGFHLLPIAALTKIPPA